MKHQVFVNSLLLSLCSMPVLATEPAHYLYAGLQQGRVSIDGFQDYFEGIYNNSYSSKYLYGIYLGGRYSFENGLFISSDIEATTRSSTSLSDISLSTGYNYVLNDDVALYSSLGGEWVWAKRRSACRMEELAICNREGRSNNAFGGIIEVGSMIKLVKRWSIQPSYSYSNAYNHGLNKFKIGNLVQVTSSFFFEVNYGYTFSKNLKQNNIQLGGRYNF